MAPLRGLWPAALLLALALASIPALSARELLSADAKAAAAPEVGHVTKAKPQMQVTHREHHHGHKRRHIGVHAPRHVGANTTERTSEVELNDGDSAGSGSNGPSPLSYRGGPIMNSGVNLYPIFYGAWDAGSQAIVTAFLDAIRPGQSFSGQNPTTDGWYNILSGYYDGQGNRIPSQVGIQAVVVDPGYSQGQQLTGDSVRAVVQDALNAGVPTDGNGLYLVLTSPDVTIDGFCTQFCGWHFSADLNGQSLKYAFIGNAATQCLGSCAGQSVISNPPNGDSGADAMISVIAHELAEAATDPYENAWTADDGEETGDVCAWNFGPTSTAPNGGVYNLEGPNGQFFLVQQIWDVNSQSCVQQL